MCEPGGYSKRILKESAEAEMKIFENEQDRQIAEKTGSDNELFVAPTVRQIIVAAVDQQSAEPGDAGGSSQQQSQMKMMTYAMPVIFLFVLYDVSSGLLLYWTMTNILSIGQQLYINHRQKAKAKAKA